MLIQENETGIARPTRGQPLRETRHARISSAARRQETQSRRTLNARSARVSHGVISKEGAR
jgi:hypothetical protein